jgi:nucleotide-binding universal stress UspA family protein
MIFLVPHDGSPASESALLLAADQAKLYDARIIVVTSLGGGSSETPADIGKATEYLRTAENLLKERGITCETHQLARGLNPAEDVVQFAEDNNIDMIFVGIKKKSRTQKIILGSNAQYIILKAPCPVVTVKRYPVS